MDQFALVWILVLAGNSYYPLSYSPPVKTLEDCQRIQSAMQNSLYKQASQCVQVTMLKGKQ